MFVGSHIETGDECKATAAVPSHVIGNIRTVTGCGTITRTSGIAAQAIVDDPVCQGDVIETSADGWIGIGFIDGTVFNLSPGTRVAVNEFSCDSSGTSQSALFDVTKGTFAFMAGRLAAAGCLTVDTPVGSIRGRAYAGGVGALSLVALTFAAMKEVHAADPDVTFLDDGNITYKDLEHGVFELVTKEAIPRHIFVEDPGETIVLSGVGSSISVNQVVNTPARMEELQAAQQDVLANYAKGLAPGGSSTPPAFNPLPIQRIDFIQPDGPPAQNLLPVIQPMNFTIPETILVHAPTPPPTLTAVAGPIEVDTAVFDNFSATSGTFVASSPNSAATLTYGISGGTAGSTVLDGVTYDVSRPGPYGSLYVNSTTGAYAFVPDNNAINALTSPTTENFTVTVSDGSQSAAQTFTININGVNDAAIISGTATGSAIEAGGVANATPGPLAVSGTLTDTDVDNTPNTFTAVSSPTASDAGYGTFTMTADGVWTYTLNNANKTVQALNVGDKLTDTFTVTTIDGTPKLVTIIIDGSNDAAVISGATTGSVTEPGCETHGMPTATGALTDTDVDNTPNTFTAVSHPTKSDAGYGCFTMTAAGVWTYKLDDDNRAVQALNVGDTLTDTFTVTTIDGTTQVVTITIHGSNDAAVIYGKTTGSVIEAGCGTPGTPTASGTLTDTDVDNTPNTFTVVNSPTASDAGYGTFTMTADGVWTYTLNNANAAVQALNVHDKLTDTFTVTTIDGTAELVTITIYGTNDAAIISGKTTGSVTEPGCDTRGTLIATGALTDTDVDNTPNTFTAVNWPRPSHAGYGCFTMTAAGVWTYTLDDDNCAVQALKAGDTLTDTFTVTTIDGTAKVVTITIHGSDDGHPNHFDSLATGAQQISDPPLVSGTPEGDTIAGNGHDGQIADAAAGHDTIIATGNSDLVQGGASPDTIKGNDGHDTVHGGPGGNSINGNDGGDTTVGGHGADHLTSSGNDRYVYSAVADSNAARFDTITDFKSGADRIDLAAFGALAFIVLSSKSTPVPAHTIACIYNSTTNQTTVYVNPTDQALKVGDSGLLEIHLQGNSTVQQSDFVVHEQAHAALAGDAIDLGLITAIHTDGTLGPTAADASSDGTVNGGACLADGNSTAQASDVHYGFDGDRGRAEPNSEARTHSTDDTNDDAVTTRTSGASVEQQHTAQKESSPALHPTAAAGSTVTTSSGAAAPLNGTINDAGSTAPNTVEVQPHSDERIDSETSSMVTSNDRDHGTRGSRDDDATDAIDTHFHKADTDSNFVFKSGFQNGPEGRGLAVASSMADSRAQWPDGDSHSTSGETGQHGAAFIHGAGAPDFEPSSNAHFKFGSAAADTPGLGDSFHFKDDMSHARGSDVSDEPAFDHTHTSFGYSQTADGAGGPPTNSEETHTTGLFPPQHHSADDFGIIPNHGSTVVTHAQHDLMV